MKNPPISRYEKSMVEISSDDILKGFLGHGFFSDKIPPFLSSESFYHWFLSKAKCFACQPIDYVRYENIRHTNIPRVLGIPDPFAYANLCYLVYLKWEGLQNILAENVKNNSHKISRVHIRKMKHQNHLFEMNYKNMWEDGVPEQKLSIGKKFCVQADISNFYPSIYSHSIPWALVGKDEAKENRNNRKLWYNKLDLAVRNMKNAETNGILIGPHTSVLISEIILTKVDQNLSSKYGYIRRVDDYKCYTGSLDEAEKFLLDLSTELKIFDLHLNVKKTKISSLPILYEEPWITHLKSFEDQGGIKINDKPNLELRRLKSILDYAVTEAIRENDGAIFNYAFKVIKSKNLNSVEKEFYVDRVHHFLLLYPYLANTVEESVFLPFEIENERIKAIAIDLYNVGIEKRWYEACSYSIYWLIKYDLIMDKDVCGSALESNDCIFLLLTYLYYKKNRCLNSLEQLEQKAEKLSESEFDRFWLFIYEVLPASKLKGEFKNLKKEKISFTKAGFTQWNEGEVDF